MWTCLSINESEMGHAYQNMGMEKFKCMFWYRLKYLKKICVQDYAYMSSCYAGSWGGVGGIPPPYHESMISGLTLAFFSSIDLVVVH